MESLNKALEHIWHIFGGNQVVSRAQLLTRFLCSTRVLKRTTGTVGPCFAINSTIDQNVPSILVRDFTSQFNI